MPFIKALKDKEERIPRDTVEALGRIGDAQAVVPLAELLSGGTKDRYTQEYAAKALAKIGGEKTRAALREARAVCEDEDLAEEVDYILNKAETDFDGGKTFKNDER